MSQTIRDLELRISEAHKASAVKKLADARARLRDEFAMAALPAMIALEISNEKTARAAYELADAMLEARK